MRYSRTSLFVLYCTALHYNVTPTCTVYRELTLDSCCVVLGCFVSCRVVWCDVASCRLVLSLFFCNVVSYYIVLCCAVFYVVVSCFVGFCRVGLSCRVVSFCFNCLLIAQRGCGRGPPGDSDSPFCCLHIFCCCVRVCVCVVVCFLFLVFASAPTT